MDSIKNKLSDYFILPNLLMISISFIFVIEYRNLIHSFGHVVISFIYGVALILVMMYVVGYNNDKISYPVLFSYFLILLNGITLFYAAYAYESMLLIDLNQVMSIEGVGLRIYTWNFMFIVSVVEELIKFVGIILVILFYKREFNGVYFKTHVSVIVAGAFMIFENAVFTRQYADFQAILDLLFARIVAGAVMVHITSGMALSLTFLFVKYLEDNERISWWGYLLFIPILCSNILVHLLYNYNVILNSYGQTYYRYISYQIIIWSYTIVVAFSALFLKYKLTTSQRDMKDL